MSYQQSVRPIARHGTVLDELTREIDGALEQLTMDHGKLQPGTGPAEPLPSLLGQFWDLYERNKADSEEPIRTVHHLACTGGTLISKSIGALPNVQLLSEVDPLSSRGPAIERPGFYPTDLIGLARTGTRPVTTDTVIEMFRQSLEALWAGTRSSGQRLVLRDHAHSQFCTEIDASQRPTLRSMVGGRFPVLSVVTVRHPVDVYLSMQYHGWLHFSPPTLDEFALRYMRFLEAYSDVPWIRYEDFVADPESVMEEISKAFALPWNKSVTDLFDAFQLSGDSGRRGNAIRPRERREVSEHIAQEIESSRNLGDLLVRLGYETKM